MKKYMILLLILVCFLGCTKTQIEYKNRTIEKEIIKECPIMPDCICESPNITFPDCICNGEKIIEKKVFASGCTERLNKCIIQADYYNSQLTNCLSQNNSISIEDLTLKLNNCEDNLQDLNNTLNDIIIITR